MQILLKYTVEAATCKNSNFEGRATTHRSSKTGEGEVAIPLIEIKLLETTAYCVLKSTLGHSSSPSSSILP